MKRDRYYGLLGVLCLVYSIVCIGSAYGAEWVSIGSMSYGDSCYDFESVTVSNNIVTVWTKLFASSEENRLSRIEDFKRNGLYRKEFDDWKYAIAQTKINCKDKSFKSISAIEYSKNGSVILSSDFSNVSSWQKIVPESQMEELHKRLCEQKSYLKKKRDWQYFHKWAFGNLYYYDAANIIISSKNIFKIWQKEVYSDEFKKKRKESDLPLSALAERQEYEISLYEVDCTKKKMKIVQSCTFDKAGIGYSCIDKDMYQVYSGMDPLFSDVGINLMKIACSQKQGSQGTQKKKK